MVSGIAISFQEVGKQNSNNVMIHYVAFICFQGAISFFLTAMFPAAIMKMTFGSTGKESKCRMRYCRITKQESSMIEVK